jgi:hypothetical protein
MPRPEPDADAPRGHAPRHTVAGGRHRRPMPRPARRRVLLAGAAGWRRPAVLTVIVVLGALLAPATGPAKAARGSNVDPSTLPGVLSTFLPAQPANTIGQFAVVSTPASATTPLTTSDLHQIVVRTGGITPLAADRTAVVEDTNIGRGVDQVNFQGGWTECGSCQPPTPNNSFKYSLTAGSTATVRFTGTQIRIYGVKEAAGGIASVTVDNRPSTNIDTYAPTQSNALIYDSGPITNSVHTAVITNIGQRDAASDAFVVSFDRAEIFTDPTLGATGGGTTRPPTGTAPPPSPPPVGPPTTIEDTSVGTYNDHVAYTGDWTECGGCKPPTPNNSFHYSLNAGATATIRWTGTRIVIYGVKEHAGGMLTVSVDGRPTTTVDTYAPTSSNALIYDSGVLSLGDHTAVITNIGEKNSASAAFAVSFDRAEVYSSPLAPTPVSGNRSGQPWLSGANGDPLMTPDDVDAFCSFRGHPCDLAQLYVARDSWNSIVQPSFAETNFAGWPGKLVIAVPPFPEDGTSNLTSCAAGAYDSYWKQFGLTLDQEKRQNSIIRLAWEANGDWYPWSGTNVSAYINCFRRIVDDIHTTAKPWPQFDWSIDAHYSQNPPSHVPTDLYPGDGYVDVISIDAYDHYPSSHTLDEFNAQADAQGGITWLYDFARAHNKLFGIAEWGVASGSGDNGGGDNPNYIQFMRDWMMARAGRGMYYEAYFNNCDKGNVGSNLYRPKGDHCLYQNTASAARYAQLW